MHFSQEPTECAPQDQFDYVPPDAVALGDVINGYAEILVKRHDIVKE